MSDHRISLAAYKEAVPLEGVPLSVTIDGFVLAAFVEAVEAAHALIDHTITDLMEVSRREVRLSALLRRFDFEAEA